MPRKNANICQEESFPQKSAHPNLAIISSGLSLELAVPDSKTPGSFTKRVYFFTRGVFWEQ